jgi:transposase-like protein
VLLQRVKDVSAASLVPFVCAAVEPDTEVRTDGWRSYNNLSEQGYRHHPISISSTGDPAHVSLPAVHSVASLLKRWLLGIHQGSALPPQRLALLLHLAMRNA